MEKQMVVDSSDRNAITANLRNQPTTDLSLDTTWLGDEVKLLKDCQ
jgi:hypothetical protein